MEIHYKTSLFSIAPAIKTASGAAMVRREFTRSECTSSYTPVPL